VPQSEVPDEKTSATQPFPTKPPPFDRQGVIAPEDLIDLTPELKAEALEILSRYKTGPLFTPPSLVAANGTQGTLVFPGQTGGANWQGGAADPETGLLYVASTSRPAAIGMRPCDPTKVPFSAMKYCAVQEYPEVRKLPLVKPPWGRITAIDLNTGSLRWTIPNASVNDYFKNHPALKGVSLPKMTGLPDRSGLMVTKTLLFAGEGGGLFGTGSGAGGPMFRALDKATGETVWEVTLPANQTGVPMTYMVAGKQYIVVPVGAPNHPAELVAFALP
jgi:quinoprotein glucose dehydrogenase